MDTYQARIAEANSLGERIRKFREQRRLTLSELASRADISRTCHWQQNADVVALIDWNLGNLFAGNFRYEQALDHLFRALGRFRNRNRISPDDTAWMQTTIGYLSYRAGRCQTAIKQFTEAIARWEGAMTGQLPIPETGHLIARRGLGSIYERLGRFQDARDCLERTYRLAQEVGENAELAWLAARLGFLYIHTGDWNESDVKMKEAWEIIDRLMPTVSDKRGLEIIQEIILNNRGLLLLRKGCYEEALEQSRKSLHKAEELQDSRGQAFCYHFIALIYAVQQDKPGEALEHIQKAESQFRRMGIRYYMSEIYACQAEIYCRLRLKPAAFPLIQEALSITTDSETGSPYQETLVRRVLGLVYAADYPELKPEWDKADDELRKSVEMLEDIEAPYDLARAHYDYGQILAKEGRVDEARERFQQARDIASRLKANGIVAEVEKELECLPA